MNIAQAKLIGLETIMQRIQAEEDTRKSKADRSELWYISPLRPGEKTASFKVDTKKNVYFDHGTGQGGDLIKFVQEYLGGKTVSEALQWLRTTNGGIPTQKLKQPIQHPEIGQQTATKELEGFQLVKEKELTNKALLAYIGQRGLPIELVRQFCKEIYYRGRGDKNLFGIGLQNDAGGWEVRAAVGSLKSVVGAKDVTTIYNSPEPNTIHVFEGMFDFLTRQHIKPLATDEAAIILNSGNMVAHGIKKIQEDPRLQTAKTILIWTQNDAIGERTLHEIALALEETHTAGSMSSIYAGFKDLNEYWVNSPEAKKLFQQPGLKIFSEAAIKRL